MQNHSTVQIGCTNEASSHIYSITNISLSFPSYSPLSDEVLSTPLSFLRIRPGSTNPYWVLGRCLKSVAMRSACDYLKDIKKGREDWTINVRIARLWESLKVTSNYELMSLDMVVLDERGDYMHASIWKGFVSKFQSLMEEGKVYRISRFRVVDNKKTHKVVSGDYMINFVPSTFVMDLADQDHQFGHHVVEIVDFGTARSRVGKNIELSDVVGCFAGLSKINDQIAFGSMVKTRVLGLQDSRLAIDQITGHLSNLGVFRKEE